jgi:hypothetical protein
LCARWRIQPRLAVVSARRRGERTDASALRSFLTPGRVISVPTQADLPAQPRSGAMIVRAPAG